jgi:hypothetical protein
VADNTDSSCSATGNMHGAQWTFVDSGVGGGNESWTGWFEPYLKLLSNPTVQAFCYIDWFWPRFSNHESFNWYNWGDARVEHSTMVGARWARAMALPSVIGAAKTKADLCRLLNCSG